MMHRKRKKGYDFVHLKPMLETLAGDWAAAARQQILCTW